MAGRSRSQKSLLGHLWGFLISRKVTVVLLLVTLALLVLSLLLPQVPTYLDAAGLEQWWAAVRADDASRLDRYERLGLLHIYRAPAFLALLGALLLNMLCCTLDRLGTLWRTVTRRSTLRLPAVSYERADWQTADVSLAQARQALRRQGYRLQEEGVDGEAHYIYGQRFRFARLGTLLTHLGLFLLALAALLHLGLAWRERLLLDPPFWQPAPTYLRHRPECVVLNGGLEVSREGDVFLGTRSELIVQVGDDSLRGTITPSAPFSACGASFFLDSYGLALQVQAFDEGGLPQEVLFDGGETFLRFSEGVTEGAFAVPAWGIRATVAPSPWALSGFIGEPLALRIDRGGQILFEGEVDPRQELEILGGRLALTARPFLVVDAVHDPGFPWFLAGGLSLTLGSALALLFPQRQLWARLTGEGALQVRFGRGDKDVPVEALVRGLDRLRGGAQ